MKKPVVILTIRIQMQVLILKCLKIIIHKQVLILKCLTIRFQNQVLILNELPEDKYAEASAHPEVSVAGSRDYVITQKTPECVRTMDIYVKNIDKNDKNTWRTDHIRGNLFTLFWRD